MRKLRWLFAMAIAVAFSPSVLAAQQAATISGRVTGDVGQPLSAVSVIIPSLNVGTLTRADETYSLIVPADRYTAGQQVEVQASLVGYGRTTETVTLTPGNTALNFELVIDPLQLEGIVATGIGTTIERGRLGVSISSVSGDEISRVQSPNIVASLSG